MNYIVMDLEWNQRFPGAVSSKDTLNFEIIQIGAIKLDADLNQIDSFVQIIHPKLYKKLNPVVASVIHLTMEDMKHAPSFPDVILSFLNWCGKDPVFCTWGPQDLFELQQNVSFYGLENPFPFPLFYYDVQKLFSLFYEDGKKRISLEAAADFLSLKKDLDFHDALSDARYTAKVLQSIDFSRIRPFTSLDYFRIPESPSEELHLKYPTYTKYVSMGFPDKRRLLRNPRVLSIPCPVCKKATTKRIRWFPNGKQYLCLSCCPNHGMVKGKIRVKKTLHSGKKEVFAIKTIKKAPAEDVRMLYHKYDQYRSLKASKTTN